MGNKSITVKFTDGTTKDFTVGDDWTDERIKSAVATSKSGTGKTIATIDNKSAGGQAASVAEPELTADAAGKTVGKVGKNIVIGTGELIGDIADKTWRFGKGVVKGIAGIDESVKAQDDAVLERIKSIKY